MKKHKKSFGVAAGMEPVVLKSWKDRGANILFAGSNGEFVVNSAIALKQMMLNL